MKSWDQYWPYKQISINDSEQRDICRDIKESCIAFIDILGFKDMVSSNIDKVILALRYLKLFRDSFFRLPLGSRGSGNIYQTDEDNDIEIDVDSEEYQNRPLATMFSDSIVISQEITKTFSFADFISAIAQIQFELLKEGILLRGGIDIGTVYHDESFIFGQGMVSAYLQESQISKYPRITISENALKRINMLEESEFENEFREYIWLGGKRFLLPPNNIERYFDLNELAYISFDKSGIPFIDYLMDGFHMLKFNSNTEDLESALDILDSENDTLLRIKHIIMDGLKKSNAQVHAKYEWLKEYYNKRISNIFESYIGKLGDDDLKKMGELYFV